MSYAAAAGTNAGSRHQTTARQPGHRAAGQAAGGQLPGSPHFPADLLNTPVTALLNEIMFWRDLDIKCISRFDAVKERLQHVMTHCPPPRPHSLRRAKITEIKSGNLFDDSPPGAALAHCVGADFVMGAGLAVEFRERFGHVKELRAGRHQPGTVATIPLMSPDSNKVERYIFHLVTKPTSRFCLPRWWEIIYSIRELARLCKDLEIKTVAMPQIGAGLDRQKWWKIRRVLEIEFAGSDTELLIFHHPSEYPKNECSRLNDTTILNEGHNNTFLDALGAAASMGAASTDAASTRAAFSDTASADFRFTATIPTADAFSFTAAVPEAVTSTRKRGGGQSTPKPSKKPTTERLVRDLVKAANNPRRKAPSTTPGRGGASKATNITVAAPKG